MSIDFTKIRNGVSLVVQVMAIAGPESLDEGLKLALDISTMCASGPNPMSIADALAQLKAIDDNVRAAEAKVQAT